MAIDPKYMRILQKAGDQIRDNSPRITGVSGLLFVSYIGASMVSSSTVGMLSELALKKLEQSQRQSVLRMLVRN